MGVKKTGLIEAVRITPAGEFIKSMIASYMVDDQGPFTMEMDKVEFTADKMDALIEEEAKEITALMESE